MLKGYEKWQGQQATSNFWSENFKKTSSSGKKKNDCISCSDGLFLILAMCCHKHLIWMYLDYLQIFTILIDFFP